MSRLVKRWTLFPALLGLIGGLALASPTNADFESFLLDLRGEALDFGVSLETLEAAFVDLSPIARVLELDRRQPEKTRTFTEYMAQAVPEWRVEVARRKFREQEPLLRRIEADYGVEPRFLVALWAVESDFGRLTGGFPVVGALATLAYDGRRSDFFRRELLEFLRLVDQGRISGTAVTGSWAGAMGQVQFMPSTFRSYSVDYDGDGRPDLWGSQADALASAANYLAGVGWWSGRSWGQQVRLPERFDRRLAGLDREKTLGEWRALGVRGVKGPAHWKASLLLPEGPTGPCFLVEQNFRNIMRWNRSTSFALAVGRLADRIGSGEEPAGTNAPPKPSEASAG